MQKSLKVKKNATNYLNVCPVEQYRTFLFPYNKVYKSSKRPSGM